MGKTKSVSTMTVAVLMSSILPAFADSCWDHNGSVMRLKAQGDQRWFYYETPRQALWASGVRQGTLLFDGWKDGNSYGGNARRFSKYCPNDPLVYSVDGPVRSDQLQVTLRGRREVQRQCVPTGKWANDVLVFTYLYNC